MTNNVWRERSDGELAEYRGALQALSGWRGFSEAFGWTRVFLLIGAIAREQRRRTNG